MNGYSQRSNRHPNLLITVKHETEERSVIETHSNHQRKRRTKTNYYPTTIYYNSNHRQKSQATRSSYPTRNYERYPSTVRPLMEIKNVYEDFDKNEIAYLTYNPRESKQRGQYRNRKAELDWDHAFDLDQLHLYTAQIDLDNHSLTSLQSSTDNSFSSF
ncbi:unnamed protein product [Adineta ricciae]|uniref:Uncharacterized protein n=1 Tax=Adineta ricciae TaxID=249248 RepID=A0A814F2X9_ADIRI|nr:unnamed protein product [Adineta ricciae]